MYCAVVFRVVCSKGFAGIRRENAKIAKNGKLQDPRQPAARKCESLEKGEYCENMLPVERFGAFIPWSVERNPSGV